MSYVLLKYVHTFAAVATICGFLLRGWWMLTDSDLLQHRVTRIVPHINDAILLLAGIGMLRVLALNPFTQTWLVAKFAGLIVYIMLGTIALKRGPTKEIRGIALAAAIAVFAWVAGVALAKTPLSWLALLPN